MFRVVVVRVVAVVMVGSFALEVLVFVYN